MNPYDALKLENQLCFPLYAAAKEVVRLYTPYLDRLGLTYTQYIVMMVLWERREVTVKELGALLYLDTGTLTPLLRKLADKGLVMLKRLESDRRSVQVQITPRGMDMREQAVEIPAKIGACVPLEPEKMGTLYQALYQILDTLSGRGAAE